MQIRAFCMRTVAPESARPWLPNRRDVFARGWKGPAAVGLWVSVCLSCGDETTQGRSSAPEPEDEQRSQGQWVPAAQVRDGLAVLPLDGVFEQVGQPPAAGDAGDVGDPAAGPDRDDEPLVVEGERLQRPAPQLRVQI